jgi:membrane associated rhomboid family serine protease
MPAMGLDSRDYMVEDEDEASRAGGPSVVTRLIVINIIVFVLWQITPLRAFMDQHFRISFDGLAQRKQVWTLVTAALSHQELMHLFWNCLFLYLCGRIIEELRGGRALAGTYLLGAIGGGLGHAAMTSAMGHPEIPALGASGAVMATLAFATVPAPHQRLMVLGLVPVPRWGVAAAYVVGDLVADAREAVAGAGATGIAHGAHLGGALTGLVFVLLALRRREPKALREAPAGGRGSRARQAGAFERLRGMISPRPRLRVLPPLERVPGDGDEPLVEGVDPATAERVDDLLRKIHDGGITSLTPEEKSFLERASSRYRK